MSRRGRRALLIAIVAVPVLAGGFVATGLAGPVLNRVDQAYARWSLESRIDDFWEARQKGDIAAAASFILPSCQSRGGLGNAVRYWSHEIHELKIQGDEADVIVNLEFTVALPGFDSGPGSKRKQGMRQKWVRSEGTWYWDPGTAEGQGLPPVGS